MKHDVFICHSAENKAIADVMCDAIEAAGVKCWIAPRDVVPGMVWAASINKAIKNSRLLVLVYSRHANESEQVWRELELATNKRKPILPFRIEDVAPTDAIEYYIGAAHWLDAHVPPVEKHLDDLTRAVRQHLGIPSETTKKNGIGGLPAESEKPQEPKQKEQKPKPVEQRLPEPEPTIPPERVKKSVNPVFLIVLLMVLIGGGIIVWTSQKPSKPVAVGTPSDSAVSIEEKEISIETSRPVGEVFQDILKIGGLGPKMVVLPAGRVLMGSTKETDGDERYNDERQHRVTIEKPFAIGQYEVTNGEYRRFKSDHNSGEYESHSLNDDDHPAVEVSWNDAVAYAKWLSEQTGKHYRLPTEAEWEYAARAGTTTRRYWGDDPDQACDYANVRDKTAARVLEWSGTHNCDDGYAVTAPVGRKKPNDFKLYDMLGNVWEWTCSEYDKNYAGAEKSCRNEGESGRSLRGGSWNIGPRIVRSAYRNGHEPSCRDLNNGFRLAQDI